MEGEYEDCKKTNVTNSNRYGIIFTARNNSWDVLVMLTEPMSRY